MGRSNSQGVFMKTQICMAFCLQKSFQDLLKTPEIPDIRLFEAFYRPKSFPGSSKEKFSEVFYEQKSISKYSIDGEALGGKAFLSVPQSKSCKRYTKGRTAFKEFNRRIHFSRYFMDRRIDLKQNAFYGLLSTEKLSRSFTDTKHFQ